MNTDIFRHQAEEALAINRVWYDLALDAHRIARKQSEAAIAASQEAMLFQRDQQESFGKMVLDLWFGKGERTAAQEG